MSVHMFSQMLPKVSFDGGYVQATKSLNGNTWRISVWVQRHTAPGTEFHTCAHTKVRRSEESARAAANEMAAFWSRSNPDFQ